VTAEWDTCFNAMEGAHWACVGTVTRYGLDGPGARIPARKGDLFSHKTFRNSCAAHTVSYLMGIGFFPGGKAGGAWVWSLTSI